MTASRLLSWTVLLGLLLLPTAGAAAQEGLDISVSAAANCAEAQFQVSVSGTDQHVDLVWEFGNGETLTEQAIQTFPHTVTHLYPAAGEYGWLVTASTGSESTDVVSASGTLHVGPIVELTSDPFPPLLTLADGSASVVLTAEAEGVEPIAFAWDLSGASTSASSGSTVTATYSSAGKYTAAVTASDACGLTANDTLTIVVGDPEADECHPAAQRIADAANALFPLQGEDLYTCEDILTLFRGEEPGSNVGFGRIWHAIQLAQTIPYLTWEEILDWHLDQGGWGALVQLNRMAQVAGDVDLAQLVERIRTGESSVRQVRDALRLSTRYGVPFADGLDALEAGISPGALRQAYRASGDLGLAPDEILGYPEAGVSPQEIKHAQQLGEDTGQDWAFLLQQHESGESWGQLKHAEGTSPDDSAEPETPDSEDGPGRHEVRTAERLASQFHVSVEVVMGLYQDACSSDWNCVRSRLMDQQHLESGKGKDHKEK
jgi:PKD repeat protein